MVETFVTDGGKLTTAFRSSTLTEASLRLPQGLYTTLRTYEGDRVLRLSAHAARLSIERGIDFERFVREALQRTRFRESRLRLTYAGKLFISVEPFEPLPPGLYAEGVRCITVPLHRPAPKNKDTGFIAQAADAYRDLPPTVHEGLMVGEDEAILEGLSSNVFFVRDGALRTEEDRVLPGVTRSLILEVAAGLLKVQRSPIHLSELEAVSESFLTSVSRGILPVVQINDVPIGSGRPGPSVAALASRFDAFVAKQAVRLL